MYGGNVCIISYNNGLSVSSAYYHYYWLADAYSGYPCYISVYGRESYSIERPGYSFGNYGHYHHAVRLAKTLEPPTIE